MSLLLISFTIFFILACLLPLLKPKKTLEKPQITTHAITNSTCNKTKGTQLKTIFSTFDGDGDGFITLEELEVSLKRLKLFVTLEEVNHMMEKVDLNKDGLIDYEEFCMLYESIESNIIRSKEGGDDDDLELREAFGIFDGNGDGVISKEELGGVLISMGLKQGEKDENCRVMIQNVDLDGDGMISFDEFKEMMIKGQKLL